ncbi:MAG: hypothetical protein ABSA66_01850 [Roseiarcus sp.]
MRMSLLKAVGFSITALVLGGALAITPAFAKGGLGGGGPSFTGGGKSTGPSWSGGSSWSGSHPWSGGPPSSGSFAPSGKAVPFTSPSWSGGPKHYQHYTRGRRYPRGWGGGVIGPYLCDDYDYDCDNGYYDNGYYYNDSDCWVSRRVYNQKGKFVGWRQVYICQDGQ